MIIKVRCAYCRRFSTKEAGAVNRASKIGAPIFCDRRCAGLARRKHKTKAQRVDEKRLYDAEYCKRNPTMLKAKKAAYFRRTYDPVKAAKERKKRMPRHVAYCRRPEYKRWKSAYDLRYRARQFGEFAEVYLLLGDVTREVNSRISDYDTRDLNDTINKSQRRRRE